MTQGWDAKVGKGWAAAAIACLAALAPAAAAGVKTSFGVSATVVTTCRIGEANPCGPVGAPAPTVGAAPPLVTYSYDAKTGTIIQKIEF